MKSAKSQSEIMRFRSLLWLLAEMLVVSSATHAEGNCPPGYYPMAPPGQQGPQGCAPIPGYNQDSAVPAASGSQWVSRWGAIATDEPNGVLGAAINMSSKKKAEKAALADCKAKGGSKCKLETWYSNGCAALVVGDKLYNVGSAATEDEAVKSGMNTCAAATTNCHVYYSDCSPPEQVR